ncbi:MAG: hypothetical protein U9R31_04440, partial [Candidatus Omnitrophota bacterium]|nr:hypothetical protein [Candidatus Omnitrophota bacterium]
EVGTQAVATQGVVATQAGTTRTAVTTQAGVTQTAVATQAAATQDVVARESASRILNQQNSVRENDTLTLRYKTGTGLFPVIDVYDAYNTLRISAAKMTESVSSSGVYEYDVEFQWGRGEHTIICKEATQGTIDGISIQVISTDLEEIASTATTVMGQVAGIDTDALDLAGMTISEANTTISSVMDDIKNLSSLTEEMAGLTDEKAIKAIFDSLSAVADRLREISRSQGLKIEEIYDISEAQATNLDYIKSKTLEIRALVELSQEILNRGSDEPVTKTWMESIPAEEGGGLEPGTEGEKEEPDIGKKPDISEKKEPEPAVAAAPARREENKE